jgi:rhodanese-related sulfurtransferase
MINRMLGVAALILGGAAVLVPSEPLSDPAGGSGPATRHRDAIQAESLAARIMERGTSGLTLVDLRSQSAFESYHIPGAVRLRAANLGPARLPAETIVVLYDEAEEASPRVWLLLRAQGYPKVYVLAGGLAAWNDEVLHPPLPPGMGGEDEDEFVGRMERSRFFGGHPVPSPARRTPVPRPRPDSTDRKKESFDIGPGGCFY